MERPKPVEIPLAAWRPLAFELVGLVLMGLLLFGAAGTVTWPQGWTFVVLWGIAVAAPEVALSRQNPALFMRRARPPEPAPLYERILWALYLPLILALPLVAGLDVHRFHWSEAPTALVYGGTPLILFGSVWAAWARAENPHFESRMRIQRELGHKVIYSGPYRIVRHPGYLAAIVQVAGAPMVLGSIWAALPAAGIAVVMALRAFFEDRALNRDLKGYSAYCRQVPNLLIPGIW